MSLRIMLTKILNSICKNLVEASQAVGSEMKDQIAKRLLAAYEAGVTDAEVLEADAPTALGERIKSKSAA
jgi:hypothetical protein